MDKKCKCFQYTSRPQLYTSGDWSIPWLKEEGKKVPEHEILDFDKLCYCPRCTRCTNHG